VLERIKARAPRLVMCCNMFEHVEDRETLAAAPRSCPPMADSGAARIPIRSITIRSTVTTDRRRTSSRTCFRSSSWSPRKSRVRHTARPPAELGPIGMCTHFAKSGAKLFMFWRGKGAGSRAPPISVAVAPLFGVVHRPPQPATAARRRADHLKCRPSLTPSRSYVVGS
jgi:hypothetical protein